MSTLSIVPRQPDRLTETVAAEVRAYMARARINQTELASALGLTQSSVSKRLRGVVAFNTDELQSIAALLGVHPAALLGGNAPSPGSPVTAPSLPITTTVRGFGQGRFGVRDLKSDQTGAPRRDAA